MSLAENRLLTFITSNEPRYSFFRCIFICVLGLLTYSNTLGSPFSFDDRANLLENPVITEFSREGILHAFYTRRAIGIISFQLNHFLTGWSLPWFHLTNILIHISAALIAYQLVKLLLRTPYAEKYADEEFRNLPLPFFVALFFVVHPVQTQAVTYIVQRFSSLATLFYLAAIVSYVKARLTQVDEERFLPVGTIVWAVATLVTSFLAFFSKETSYTLPFAIVIVELLFFKSSFRKIIFLGAGGLVALTALFSKLVSTAGSFTNVVSALDQATRLQTTASRTDYLFTQFRVIITYIRLIFLPIGQRIDYDYPLLKSFSDWRVFCSLIVIAALISMAVWMIIRSRNSYAHLRFISFGILWFFLTLSIESSFIPIIDLIFEHRLYLPSFGAITATSTTVLMFTRNKELDTKKRIFEGSLIIALMLALVSWKRNLAWQSEIALWEDSTSKSPNSARGWNNLAGAYILQKEAQKALKAAVRSIELDPSKADAWNNLGIALDLFGVYSDRFNRTSEMFKDPRSVEDKVVRKWLGDVNNNLGLAYELLGNSAKASENYRNAIGYNPALGLCYYNLGILSAAMGDLRKYEEQHQILLLIDPSLALRLEKRVGKR